MFVVPGIVCDARRDRMVTMVLIKIREILTRVIVSIISLILITPFDLPLLVGIFTVSLVSMVANGVDGVVFFSLSTLFHCVPLCSTVYLLGTR